MTNLIDVVFVELDAEKNVKSAHKITCERNQWSKEQQKNCLYRLKFFIYDKEIVFENCTFPNIV